MAAVISISCEKSNYITGRPQNCPQNHKKPVQYHFRSTHNTRFKKVG